VGKWFVIPPEVTPIFFDMALKVKKIPSSLNTLLASLSMDSLGFFAFGKLLFGHS
jgi:hypothetical protein